MEKNYQPAEVEIIRIDNADIITESPADPMDDPLSGQHRPNGWT